MGILDAIQGNRIYLDTNIWIYALEGYPAFIQNLTHLFQSMDLMLLDRYAKKRSPQF